MSKIPVFMENNSGKWKKFGIECMLSLWWASSAYRWDSNRYMFSLVCLLEFHYVSRTSDTIYIYFYANNSAFMQTMSPNMEIFWLFCTKNNCVYCECSYVSHRSRNWILKYAIDKKKRKKNQKWIVKIEAKSE